MSAEPPLVAGPIHGVRVWRIQRGSGESRLAGVFQDSEWPPGRPLKARCVGFPGGAVSHTPPVRDCDCGIYALHPDERAIAYTELVDFEAATPPHAIVGIIEAWGRIELYRDGFRAEYARVGALAVLGRHRLGAARANLEALADRYDAELLRFCGVDELVAHCRERGLGLDERAIEGLVGVERDDPWEEAGGRWLGSPSPGPSRTTPPPARSRTRWERARELLGKAAFLAFAALWYAFWAALALAFVVGIVAAILDEGPYTGRDLRILDEALVRHGTELSYIAVVRNASRDEAALAVHPRGRFLGTHGEEVGAIGERAQVDLPAHLAPGATGVVIDRQRARGLHPEDVGRIDVELVGERVPLAAGAARPPRVEEVRLARPRCRLSAIVRSPARAPDAPMTAVARDRSGAITAAGRLRAGALPAGRSRHLLGEAGEPCHRSLAEVDLYPRSRRSELAD